jgi:hypothetical protein
MIYQHVTNEGKIMPLEGKGRVYQHIRGRLVIYIPSAVSKDSAFPFSPGDDVIIKIKGKSLTVTKGKKINVTRGVPVQIVDKEKTERLGKKPNRAGQSGVPNVQFTVK